MWNQVGTPLGWKISMCDSLIVFSSILRRSDIVHWYLRRFTDTGSTSWEHIDKVGSTKSMRWDDPRHPRWCCFTPKWSRFPNDSVHDLTPSLWLVWWKMNRSFQTAINQRLQWIHKKAFQSEPNAVSSGKNPLWNRPSTPEKELMGKRNRYRWTIRRRLAVSLLNDRRVRSHLQLFRKNGRALMSKRSWPTYFQDEWRCWYDCSCLFRYSC